MFYTDDRITRTHFLKVIFICAGDCYILTIDL